MDVNIYQLYFTLYLLTVCNVFDTYYGFVFFEVVNLLNMSYLIKIAKAYLSIETIFLLKNKS